LPVSSRLSGTPRSSKKAMVSGTPNVRRTLAIPFWRPLKSCARTTSFVTLHRPPPEMRIFAPIFFALSIAAMRNGTPRSRAERPAEMAAMSPAAPAPITARSKWSEGGKELKYLMSARNRFRGTGLGVIDIVVVISTVTQEAKASEVGCDRAAGFAAFRVERCHFAMLGSALANDASVPFPRLLPGRGKGGVIRAAHRRTQTSITVHRQLG